MNSTSTQISFKYASDYVLTTVPISDIHIGVSAALVKLATSLVHTGLALLVVCYFIVLLFAKLLTLGFPHLLSAGGAVIQFHRTQLSYSDIAIEVLTLSLVGTFFIFRKRIYRVWDRIERYISRKSKAAARAAPHVLFFGSAFLFSIFGRKFLLPLTSESVMPIFTLILPLISAASCVLMPGANILARKKATVSQIEGVSRMWVILSLYHASVCALSYVPFSRRLLISLPVLKVLALVVLIWVQLSGVFTGIVFDAIQPVLKKLSTILPVSTIDTHVAANQYGIINMLKLMRIINERQGHFLQSLFQDGVVTILALVFVFTPSPIAVVGMVTVALLLPAMRTACSTLEPLPSRTEEGRGSGPSSSSAFGYSMFSLGSSGGAAAAKGNTKGGPGILSRLFSPVARAVSSVVDGTAAAEAAADGDLSQAGGKLGSGASNLSRGGVCSNGGSSMEGGKLKGDSSARTIESSIVEGAEEGGASSGISGDSITKRKNKGSGSASNSANESSNISSSNKSAMSGAAVERSNEIIRSSHTKSTSSSSSSSTSSSSLSLGVTGASAAAAKLDSTCELTDTDVAIVCVHFVRWLEYWVCIGTVWVCRAYGFALWPSATMLLSLWLQHTYFNGAAVMIHKSYGFLVTLFERNAKIQQEKLEERQRREQELEHREHELFYGASSGSASTSSAGTTAAAVNQAEEMGTRLGSKAPFSPFPEDVPVARATVLDTPQHGSAITAARYPSSTETEATDAVTLPGSDLVGAAATGREKGNGKSGYATRQQSRQGNLLVGAEEKDNADGYVEVRGGADVNEVADAGASAEINGAKTSRTGNK